MEIQKLRMICDKVQQIFDKSEEVSIQIYDRPFLDGDLDTFILKTECYRNREGRSLVDEYIKRVEVLLDKMGYDVEQKMYSSTDSGPIDGTVVAFHPIERELSVE
ncbi:hypothetical protein ACTQ33_15815 [Candidatus Avoscillospira sp. LCP25S3_F1]|uniref:hypothetical protein n=1 Tax=Candidatus Avoscillospira sp. LCP25S3_F1 TaxID=3438825 RepID=UPI003F93F10D